MAEFEHALDGAMTELGDIGHMVTDEAIALSRARLLALTALDPLSVQSPNALAENLIDVARSIGTLSVAVDTRFVLPTASKRPRNPITVMQGIVHDVAGIPTNPTALEIQKSAINSPTGVGVVVSALRPATRVLPGYMETDMSVNVPNDFIIFKTLERDGDIVEKPWINAMKFGRNGEQIAAKPFDVVKRESNHVSRYLRITQALTRLLVQSVDNRLDR